MEVERAKKSYLDRHVVCAASMNDGLIDEAASYERARLSRGHVSMLFAENPQKLNRQLAHRRVRADVEESITSEHQQSRHA